MVTSLFFFCISFDPPQAKRSAALPFEACPPALDGTLIGDVGFDPVGFSSTAKGPTFADIDGLTWYREAELTHGRIAQMAVVGFIWPALFGPFQSQPWAGVDSYSELFPLAAFEKVPLLATVQILAFMFWVETKRIGNMQSQGRNYVNGDIGLGQGAGRWNPFGFNYTPEEYAEKQLQEIKHGRLAMLGVTGLYFQAQNSGMNIVDQLGGALSAPEYYARAGYFLPEGI